MGGIGLVVGAGGSEEETKLGEALGLAYLQSALRKEHPETEVMLLNAIIDGELREVRRRIPVDESTADRHPDAEAAAVRLAKANPMLCGVSLIYQRQRGWTKVFAETLKGLLPECHIVVGGMYATSAWATLLSDLSAVDSVCMGEGDQVFLELYEALRTAADFSEIEGLALRRADGQPIAAGRTSAEWKLLRPPLAKLSPAELGESPFPDRQQLDRVLELGGIIQVEASRGCNAPCIFCDARLTDWRPRPIPHLVAELEQLANQFPDRLIYLVDNIFLGFSADGSHLARGRELAQAILDSGISIRFVIQDRSANIHRETFRLLQQAGLCEVYLGIESFADSALQAIGKGRGASAASNQAALQTLSELGIYTQFGFLPFHEKVTFDELQQTIAGLALACSTNAYLHLSNFNELIPYEGTYLARRYERDHGVQPPESNPWAYRDERIRYVRNWMWRFSGALWPVTGQIFHAIQSPDYQLDLWRTLPTKNNAFVEFALYLLETAGDDRRDDAEAAYRAAVSRGVESIRATLAEWRSDSAVKSMLIALDAVDAEEPLGWPLD